MNKHRIGLSVSVLALGIALAFQNCAQPLEDADLASELAMGFSLNPSTATIHAGESITLTPVNGTPNGTFQLISGGGYVDAVTGTYTAPPLPTVAKVRVKSVAGARATATITVIPPAVGLGISPASTSVYAGQSVTFAASGGVAPYVYSLNPPSAGTINSSGVFTAGATGSVSVVVTDASSTMASSSVTILPAPSGSQTLTFTGADQSFTVPAGVTSVTVKMWGGGGGGAESRGGGGGYASATLSVTSGEVLKVVVAGGGGAGSNSVRRGGGGGGASALLRGTTALLVAAGAGGASGEGNTCVGGAGGGASGIKSTVCDTQSPSSQPGGGGTQSSAGLAGTGGHGNGTAAVGRVGGQGGGTGASLADGGWSSYGAGGRGNSYAGDGGGGGGGGGLYGGGGGGAGTWGSPGGGGSSYVPTGGSTSAGSGFNPGNASDTDRGGAGLGGTTDAAGASGRVKISW